MKNNNLYPIFLKLDKIQTLIVGGGHVALEKVKFILRQSPDAKIKIVAPEFNVEIIVAAIENANIQIVERSFLKTDLEGIKLLILATNKKLLNAEISALAAQQEILTNVVDSPSDCDFYTAAVMQKGAIKIAVSSNGASPTLAKRLRDILEEVIPDEVEQSAINLQEVRRLLKGDLLEKIKTLNAITAVLSNDSNHKFPLINNAALQYINLN